MTLANVDSQLHPLVKHILWSSVLNDLNLTTQTNETKSDFMELRCKDQVHPMELKSYQLLASHHNTLAKHYVSLVGPTRLPQAFEFDSDLSRDPVIRLTCQAANILLLEMRRIEQRLYQARLERRQQQPHAEDSERTI